MQAAGAIVAPEKKVNEWYKYFERSNYKHYERHDSPNSQTFTTVLIDVSLLQGLQGGNFFVAADFPLQLIVPP